MPTAKKSKTNAFIDPQTGRISITEAFGADLATLLAQKIVSAHKKFPHKDFVRDVRKEVVGKGYTERVGVIADALHRHLPQEYAKALAIVMRILGPENPNETGMFRDFYWLLPVGKFVERYGLEHFSESVRAIEEITKRNTGEYAIRPFAMKYPARTIRVCRAWAKSPNFHLRRLASEGLRPKLPWAPKLSVWNDDPKPVFEILDILKEDEVMFVKKSVANHLRDWLKVNPVEARKVVASWSKSKNKNTQWILRHAER